MRDIFSEHAAEMGLVGNQQVIQAFVPNRADPALSKGIRIRCLPRGEQNFETLALKNSVERPRKFRVTVMNEEALRNPHPNPEALRQLHLQESSPADAESFARAGKLARASMNYVAAPGGQP